MKCLHAMGAVWMAAAGIWGVAWGAEPATSRPAESKPADTAPATEPAKREVPLTVAGKADPRAPGYIVLFEEKADAKGEVARLEKLYKFKTTYTYDMKGFKGFAAVLPAEVVEKLRWDVMIKSIEHDGAAGVN